MFGGSKPPQKENTYFAPKSPYGAAKLYGHGLLRYTGKVTVFLLAAVYCLITKVL